MLDHLLADRTRKILSVVLIGITVFLFWVPHYRTGKTFLLFDLSTIPVINRLFDFTRVLDLKPRLIDGVLGILLITPLYLRDLLYWKGTTVYSMVSYCLNLSLASTISVICLSGGTAEGSFWSGLWPMKDIKLLLLGAAILLMWAGLREIAAIAYLLLFVAIFMNASVVSHAMGFIGYVCVLCGSLGLILQNGLGPKEFLGGVMTAYRRPGKHANGRLRMRGEQQD